MHKVNILLVDDNEQKLTALESIIAPLGQNIVMVRSGQDALKEVLAQDFAAILMDVQMPIMDGFETASLIRQRKGSKNTPIIFITSARQTEEDMRRGYALGAVDYILSPIMPEVLQGKLATFVDLYRATGEIKQQATALALANKELASHSRELEQLNKRLERASIESQTSRDFLLRLIDVMPELIFVINAKRELVLVNKSMCDMFALTRSQLMGSRDVDLFRDETCVVFMNGDMTLRDVGDECATTCRMPDAAGQLRDLDIYGVLFLDAQGQKMALGVLRDVTEHKQLLEKLEAARLREQQDRESASMDRIALTAIDSAPEQVPGARLRDNDPELFADLVQQFEKAVNMALEQRVLRVDHPIGSELLALAGRLGAVRAGPREAIDIYVQAMKTLSRDVPPQKARAYTEEGRLLMLELMGNLVSFYR